MGNASYDAYVFRFSLFARFISFIPFLRSFVRSLKDRLAPKNSTSEQTFSTRQRLRNNRKLEYRASLGFGLRKDKSLVQQEIPMGLLVGPDYRLISASRIELLLRSTCTAQRPPTSLSFRPLDPRQYTP